MRFECDMLEDFNEAFEIPYAQSPTLGEKLGELRIRLLEEEVQEYADAVRSGDLLEILDALGDIAYILAGSVLNHGLQHVIDDAEIHRSNMAKLVDGKVLKRDDGKVVKPDDWKPPNLKQFLSNSSTSFSDSSLKVTFIQDFECPIGSEKISVNFIGISPFFILIILSKSKLHFSRSLSSSFS